MLAQPWLSGRGVDTQLCKQYEQDEQRLDSCYMSSSVPELRGAEDEDGDGRRCERIPIICLRDSLALVAPRARDFSHF